MEVDRALLVPAGLDEAKLPAPRVGRRQVAVEGNHIVKAGQGSDDARQPKGVPKRLGVAARPLSLAGSLTRADREHGACEWPALHVPPGLQQRQQHAREPQAVLALGFRPRHVGVAPGLRVDVGPLPGVEIAGAHPAECPRCQRHHVELGVDVPTGHERFELPIGEDDPGPIIHRRVLRDDDAKRNILRDHLVAPELTHDCPAAPQGVGHGPADLLGVSGSRHNQSLPVASDAHDAFALAPPDPVAERDRVGAASAFRLLELAPNSDSRAPLLDTLGLDELHQVGFGDDAQPVLNHELGSGHRTRARSSGAAPLFAASVISALDCHYGIHAMSSASKREPEFCFVAAVARSR